MLKTSIPRYFRIKLVKKPPKNCLTVVPHPILSLIVKNLTLKQALELLKAQNFPTKNLQKLKKCNHKACGVANIFPKSKISSKMSTQKISIFRINKNWTKTFKNSQKKISIMMSDLFLLFFRLKLNRKIFIFTIVKALSQRTSKITKNRFSKNSKKKCQKNFFFCV